VTLKEEELIRSVYARTHWRCFCGRRVTQRAHIIGQTDLNYRIFGKEIIDNPLNWRGVCGLSHNKMVDAGRAPGRLEYVASLIVAGDQAGIDKFVKENIERRGYVPQIDDRDPGRRLGCALPHIVNIPESDI
jgi:hypothetical protein